MTKSMHLALFLEPKGCHYAGWRFNPKQDASPVDWKMFKHPHVSRTLATLDHISGGRAAWNVVTSTSDGQSNNFTNRFRLLSHTDRYQKAEQFIESVKLVTA
ncbi:LLM class flavin-dependent oxidoreductase [Paenibacillus sp. OK003]|uniref:LLM class flavin-dependent oxidoreductase n=1 Tax=Paenibacillus sp. OK003 TaxID=1884380 RepID=UPI0008C08B75|nr:LLM class flavin-dependent oxidoreductase [Paenibacillus sp. OK003]SEL97289.1 Luciferase-like monooxygenase [Paenibacillus sp. OK003]